VLIQYNPFIQYQTNFQFDYLMIYIESLASMSPHHSFSGVSFHLLTNLLYFYTISKLTNVFVFMQCYRPFFIFSVSHGCLLKMSCVHQPIPTPCTCLRQFRGTATDNVHYNKCGCLLSGARHKTQCPGCRNYSSSQSSSRQTRPSSR